MVESMIQTELDRLTTLAEEINESPAPWREACEAVSLRENVSQDVLHLATFMLSYTGALRPEDFFFQELEDENADLPV
jgi:hypothetical protein